MIASPTEETIARAATLLQQGEVVAIPTETVYGLGANALSDVACEKIFQLKGRPPNNPLIVHVSSKEEAFILIKEDQRSSLLPLFEKLSVFWPGPLTIVVPKVPTISNLATAGSDTVGIRVPRHPIALQILALAKVPVAAPSANISNYVSPTTAQHVYEGFGNKISMIVDGGTTEMGIESTVVQICGDSSIKLLRPGAITLEMLADATGVEISQCKANKMPSGKLQSPGLLDIHYAPRTPLQFIDEVDLDSLMGQRLGYIAFQEGQRLSYDFYAISVLSSNGDKKEIAARLYESLRDMDVRDLDLILIDRCNEEGLGKAIMDRLSRAVRKRKGFIT